MTSNTEAPIKVGELGESDDRSFRLPGQSLVVQVRLGASGRPKTLTP